MEASVEASEGCGAIGGAASPTGGNHDKAFLKPATRLIRSPARGAAR
jgi:hypothetical protein